jgi:hypothetical protein
VELNRAIAVAEVDGADTGLALVDRLELDGYQYFHSTRADLLRRLGRACPLQPVSFVVMTRRRDEETHDERRARNGVTSLAGSCTRMRSRRQHSDGRPARHYSAIVDVPVQFFQSAIAIELAVTGALLWQMRFFESRDATRREVDDLPDSRLRLALALILGATLLGSLWAIADEGPHWAALAVTIGIAVSLIPILLRVLPPLAKDAATNERDPDYAITVLGLVMYVAVVAGFLVLLDLA